MKNCGSGLAGLAGLTVLTVFSALGIGSMMVSCRSGPAAPDLAALYNRPAQYHDAYRNPVIVLPGILGSRLENQPTGPLVWGAFGGDNVNPHSVEGARLVALPMARGKPLSELRDDVESVGVLAHLNINFFGLPIMLAAYAQILQTLGAGGYRDEELGMGAIDYGDDHFTCFQFHYDCRRDNSENAAKLHNYLIEKRAYVREQIKKRYGVDRPDIKFDIIAHSMGGLVTRYLMRYGKQPLPEDGSLPEITWAGSKLVDRVIFIGTPNAGSVFGFMQQVEGIQFAPIFHKHEAARLDTFPSIYQLFPRARNGSGVDAAKPEIRLDIFDSGLWDRMNWGLLNEDQDWVLQYILPDVPSREERRAIALDHLSKCLSRARQFGEALDRPARAPDSVSYYAVVGDAVPTGAVVGVDTKTGELEVLETGPGDGTVLRSSVLLDERVGNEWQYSLKLPIE